jgi:hypothetical protein
MADGMADSRLAITSPLNSVSRHRKIRGDIDAREPAIYMKRRLRHRPNTAKEIERGSERNRGNVKLVANVKEMSNPKSAKLEEIS